jgi:hypothetical protein
LTQRASKLFAVAAKVTVNSGLLPELGSREVSQPPSRPPTERGTNENILRVLRFRSNDNGKTIPPLPRPVP